MSLRDVVPAQSERFACDHELFTSLATTGDAAAREELVKRFLPLALQLAKRYPHARESADDLTQVAALGLIKAINRYQPDRGNAFSSFAVPTILGELRRHFRGAGWAVTTATSASSGAARWNVACAHCRRAPG